MRIIGGRNRGRKLKAPEGLLTRPTLDKVRGAVFNVLFDVADFSVLDLFGGSGAMAFEAMSRGAAKAVIVEKNRAAFKVINENKSTLAYGDEIELRLSDYKTALRQGDNFDLIFLDPPYQQGMLEDALVLIDEKKVLAPDGIIVAETATEHDFSCPVSSLEVVKEKQYGITKIIFLRSKGV